MSDKPAGTSPSALHGVTSPRGVVRALVLFTLAQSVLVVLIALGLSHFVWTDVEAVRAIYASAWLAVAVQCMTFAIARVVARAQVMAGWALGMILRFATVAFWAFLGIKAMGIVAGPALLSLVIFFFVSTLVEPLFLNV